MVAFIDWYHDNIDGERTKVKSARVGDPHTHEISRVSVHDEGLYTCVVGNVLGKAEASAYLQVNSGCLGSIQRNKDLAAIEHFLSMVLLLMLNRFMGNPLLILNT